MSVAQGLDLGNVRLSFLKRQYLLRLQGDLPQKRRSAAGGSGGEDGIECLPRKRRNRAGLLELYRQTNGGEHSGQRNLMKRMVGAGTVTAVAKTAFRLFRNLTDSMEIVAGRDYRE